MSPRREFSEAYLAQASRPTLDLIVDALTAGAYDRVGSLVEQLHNEVCTMLSGYLCWPKIIRRSVESLQGRHTWREMDAAARQSLSCEPPPANQVFAAWDSSKQWLLDAAREHESETLEMVSREWRNHALAVHDAYMNYAAVLVSELARRFGPNTMQKILTDVMEPEAMGMRPELSFRRRVETLIKFTRLHLLPFKLLEDDEKMTFIASPCPSGGRQILAGLYQQGGPGEMIRGRSPVTYNRTEIPAYCCHESALEAASIRRFGSPMFVVDLAYQPGHQPCQVYVYKDPEKIPARFYQRVGLARDDDLIARS